MIEMFCVADSNDPQTCAIPKGTHKSNSFEKELKREKKGKLETHKLQRMEKGGVCQEHERTINK
jgi:hypothetical protein